MRNPNDPILRRFNGYRSTSSIRLSLDWKLRTEKLIDGAWVRVASWPSKLDLSENEGRERMRRHAEAFGGSVRLMRGDLLLQSWEDGEACGDWETAA
jgi:hypothetical protein